MNFLDGYDYRINIIGSDSTIIVDSNTGLIKGCVADHDENIIVDPFTRTLHGTLVGNVVGYDLSILVDINNKSVNANSISAEVIQGDLVNRNGDTVFDSFHNTITNIDFINVDSIKSKNIQGDLVNSYGNTVFDSVHNTIKNIDFIKSKNVQGDLVNHNGDTVFRYQYPDEIDLYASSALNIHTVIKDLNDPNGLSAISISYYRNDIDNPENLKKGDIAGLFSCKGYFDDDYKDLGAVGFLIDPNADELDNDESFPSLFVVLPANGKHLPVFDSHEINYSHPVLKECLVFGNDTLSAPIFKVGTHEEHKNIKAQKGMIIFNDTSKKFQGYTGTEWVDLH